MIKIIDPRIINLYLTKIGPAIYYFNGSCLGINETIVKQMNEWARKYPVLNVYEMNFAKYMETRFYTSVQELNKISLYYNHDLILELFEPGENDIKTIFHKCIECYNHKQDVLAGNIGKGRSSKNTDDENNKTKTITLVSQNPILKRRAILRCLKRKIIFPDDEITKKNQIEKILEKNKYIKIAPKSDTFYISNKVIDFKTKQNLVLSQPSFESKQITHDLNFIYSKPIIPSCNTNLNINSITNQQIQPNFKLNNCQKLKSEVSMQNLTNLKTSVITESNKIKTIPNNTNTATSTKLSQNNKLEFFPKNGKYKIPSRCSRRIKAYKRKNEDAYKNTNITPCIYSCQNKHISSPKHKFWFDEINTKDLPLDILDE